MLSICSLGCSISPLIMYATFFRPPPPLHRSPPPPSPPPSSSSSGALTASLSLHAGCHARLSALLSDHAVSLGRYHRRATVLSATAEVPPLSLPSSSEKNPHAARREWRVFVCVVNDDLLCVMVFSDQSRGSRIDNLAIYDRSICYRWTAQVESG